MGLINIQTDLKSLKFGKDRPGGGSSKQPYIQKPISDTTPISTGGKDFILRSGLRAPQRALEDIVRLSKYLADGPNGILYTVKENLLSRVSVGTESTKGPAYAMGNLNAGVYTPLSTLAQAGVGYAGVHLNKMGIDPTGLFPLLSLNKYETIVKQNNKSESNTLTFVKGKETTLPGTSFPIFLPDSLKGDVTNRLLKILKSKQFTFSLDNNISEYGGGPGSILGIGKTRIKFADQRTGQNNLNLSKSKFFTEGFKVFKHTDAKTRTFDRIDYRNYLGASTEQGITPKENGINDDGKLVEKTNISTGINPHSEENTEFSTYINSTLEFENNRIEKRINIGSIKKIKGKSLVEDPSKENIYDKINASPIYNSTIGNGRQLSDDTNDLVAFRIGIIDHKAPSNLQYMNFRSYIDSFSDSYSSDWKSQKYMGRGEKFYKYEGFDRSISMAFTVVAHSQGEMNGMYQKLNFLASSLSPTYTTNGYMAGNLVKLTLGNYIYEQIGFISSFTYDIPEESSWDLSLTGHAGDGEISSLDNAQDSKINPDELPFMIKVTGLKFTPIHDFRPELSKQNRFITKDIPFTTPWNKNINR